MSDDTMTVDGTAAEIGHDLVPAEQRQQPSTLFHTDDPAEVIHRASRVADSLKTVLTQQRLTKRIGNKDHVLVEGWQTLGSMLGVVPVCVWTKKLDNGWEARCEARLLDGRVVGAAEAQCTRDESLWSSRDEYALRSMAQTRATSKALRGPLGFVITLAGYSATPAEEMPADPPPAQREAQCSPDQYKAIVAAYHDACDPVAAFTGKLDELGAPPNDIPGARVTALTTSQADELLAFLQAYVVGA